MKNKLVGISLIIIGFVFLLVAHLEPQNITSFPDNCMSYVMDVTLDDTEAPPVLGKGTEHIKTWRVRNCGTTTWKEYELRRITYSGPRAGVGKDLSPLAVVIPEVGPGQEAGISIPITVPQESGDYKAFYEIAIPEGSKPHYQHHRFGEPLWVSFTAK